MSKHRRLFDLLPDGARPKDLVFVDRRNTGWTGWYAGNDDPEFILLDHHGHALIEHAARLHYEQDRGYEIFHCGDSLYEVYSGCPDKPITGFVPLIDALLAAAEHAREGEGEK